jgi:hypothetical protein
LAILPAASSAGKSPRIAVESLRAALLWLMGFAGGFVFIEPSPYEIMGLLTIFIFAATGLSFRASLLPLILFLILLDLGYASALVQVIHDSRSVIWVFVSAFLAATAIFYAATLGRNTQARLDWLLRGYVAAALVASLAAIAGYLHVSGAASDLFLRYGRARGTFNDPNVLGAFLVPPALLLLQRIFAGRPRQVLKSGIALLVLAAALLLSFSRGAWAQFGICTVLLIAVTFAGSRSGAERIRIAAIATYGTLILALFIAALLSIESVADLFKERASLEQSYDACYLGRFGRYSLGFDLALDRPLGIGPLQFGNFFPEDAHNTFLNTFMSGGWLGGFAYLTLTLTTLAAGLRLLFVATPWRSHYQAMYIAFIGVAGEGAIIDIDHWRHYFLILGVLWGLMAATRVYRTSDRRAG